MSRESLGWGNVSTTLAPAEQEPVTGLLDRHRWSGLARNADADRVRGALLADEHVGVVITGDRGVGKTQVGRAVIAGLGPDVYTLQLRSAGPGSATPYGCLAFTLARLPQSSLGSPTAILQGITSLIRDDAAGRKCVIFLDNAGTLDELSTGVLLNLVQTRTARLVATVPRTTDLPPDFYWLITAGQLAEVRLANLTEVETLDVLQAALGHRVSSALASQLHHLVGGSPTLLQAVVSEQIERGNLVLSGSVWTLIDEVVLDGRTALEDIVRARYARETPVARELIEVLSCARTLPLARLARMYSPGVIADMEDAGQIVIDRTDRHLVSLGDRYLGDIVRNWLSVERRLELRDKVPGHQQDELNELTVEDLLAYAAWTHDCGAPLSPAHAVAGAAAAVRLFDPKFALRCAGNLSPQDPEWAGGQLQKSAAYLQLGQPLQAMAALDDVSDAQLSALGAEAYAELIAAKVDCMSWLSDRTGQVPALIKRARARLEEPGVRSLTPPEELTRSRLSLDLCEFNYLSFVGNYAAMMDRLTAAASSDLDEVNPVHRLRSGIILMEALCMTGKESEARKLLREIGGQLGEWSNVPRIRENYAWRSFNVLLLSGLWRQSIDMLKDASGRAGHGLHSGSASTDLAVGLAYVYAGRGYMALGPLLAAIAQLEVRPSLHSLRQAYAATAFAYAQTGNSVQATVYLDRARSADGPARFAIRSSADFCMDMASRWLGDPAAKARLVAAAEEHFQEHRYTLAGIFMLGATVSGNTKDFEFLEEIAALRQGPLAELSRTVAVGSRKKDAAIMLEAAAQAAVLELDAVQARCAALAFDFAKAAGLSGKASAAHIMLESLAERLPALPITPRNKGPLLTDRERQIATLAGNGVTNKDIALAIGISVRTVEGHLYQVFTKLGVSSRSDLLGLI
ncbi:MULTISPECIES: helix-turn-helix transcriptional regulator [unclassified Arthrobacter]|uniref:helix-turn-helix transcriptional regulator n=1 Tax=unclassified Arthrobacter TaxID=235627 RepID=UPI002E0620AB|nr:MULTISPECIES: LuxR C-terminal-related transcriptional regulator [unclassified Arthrobacter]MEC5190372.1 DNA-binding NarL/FixJ family response regulator/tetratricopeptide (TPR) repeat protein [Arthrobacter sp. MP_M4]MEC5201723.1 DNA-binding NarL/FixJ family response regulator/tetratricopeptide (TPR) repeat protein [Arthrobacter sp. MP_M7]